jgi:hypothetical protein
MVQENVVEMIMQEEALDEQETETAEELAQEIAIQRGYYDGRIPADIPAPPVYRQGVPNWRASLNGAAALLPNSNTSRKRITVRLKRWAASAPPERRSMPCLRPTLPKF